MKSLVTRRGILVGAAASAAALASSSQDVIAKVPRIHEVAIKSFKFDPEHIIVRVGDIVRWTNQDLAPHTASAQEFGWDTGEIIKEDSQTISVTEGMETSYFCAFHPHMKGSIELI